MRSYDHIFLDITIGVDYYIVDGGDQVSNRASITNISAYLARVKNLLSAGKYDFVPRGKNVQALSQYGLTITDVKNEILDFEVRDYYKGPKLDFDASRPGDVWEFKRNIDGIPFYVKVKIVQENGEDVLKCLSFHEDEFV